MIEGVGMALDPVDHDHCGFVRAAPVEIVQAQAVDRHGEVRVRRRSWLLRCGGLDHMQHNSGRSRAGEAEHLLSPVAEDEKASSG